MPKPINPNTYVDDQGRALVGLLEFKGGAADLKASIKRAVDLIGGDPWELPQIKVAAAAEGRAKGPGDYVVRKA